jgi:hypothetical protein
MAIHATRVAGLLWIGIGVAVEAAGVSGLLVRMAIHATRVAGLLWIAIGVAVKASRVSGLLVRVAIHATRVPGLLWIDVGVAVDATGFLRDAGGVGTRRRGRALPVRSAWVAAGATVGAADCSASGLPGFSGGGWRCGCRVAGRAGFLTLVFRAGAPRFAWPGLPLAFGLLFALTIPLALTLGEG